MKDWISAELAPWRAFGMGVEDLHRRLDEQAKEDPSVFIFHVDGGKVRFDDKRAAFASQAKQGLYYDNLLARAPLYQDILQTALRAFHVGGKATLAIDLCDMSSHRAMVPVFSFQKPRGSRNILIPDVDCIHFDFYLARLAAEPQGFADKKNEAIFVGSTTGNPLLSPQHVQDLRNARLRSAVFFKNVANVIFHLPVIVQYQGDNTLESIESLGVQGRKWSFDEQLERKFLLSIDGNGATCSRVVIGLVSNSVLMKYNSPHHLFYFKGLQPWKHFIPLRDDQDVLDYLSEHSLQEGLYTDIARSSRAFALRYLSRIHVLRYTAELLRDYIALFGVPGDPDGPSLLLDSYIRRVNGDLSWSPLFEGTEPEPASPAICGFGIVPDSRIDAEDVQYRTIDGNGVPSSIVSAPNYCGADGPIFGFQIMLRGEAARGYRLYYEARLMDGSVTTLLEAGEPVHSASPIVGLKLHMEQR